MTKSRSWVRSGSIAAMVAVPALAIAFLGGDILAGRNLPSLQIGATRDFTAHGSTLSNPAKATATDSNEVFLGTWQNTVIIPPTPRV